MATKTFNARSVHYLRDLGYMVDVVEKVIPYTKFKKDLFGCFDILAVGKGSIRFVQVTSRSNAASRRAKVRNNESYPLIREMENATVELHLWRKIGRRWDLKIEYL